MSLIVPDEAERNLLDALVNGDSLAGVLLKLFKNNLTPDQDTVIGDFTESDFSGYAAADPSFGAATTVSHKGQILDSSSRDFVHNGGATSNTVYGYYLVDSTGTILYWCERFASSQVMANNGDTITIQAKFTGQSEF